MAERDFIFGIRSVIEAIQSGKNLERVLFKDGLQTSTQDGLFKELMTLIKEYDIDHQKVPVQRINRVTDKNHQGVIAYLAPVDYQDINVVVSAALAAGKKPLVVVLDGITDVRNFGAIARSAECAGADAIVIPEKGSAQITSDAIKTSAGALFRVPVCRVPKLWYTMKFLKESGFFIVAASEKGDTDYRKHEYKGPVALVMGSEDKGISSQIMKMADQMVTIPVKGEIASLNVSVAAGILIYEIQRNKMNF
jgi:23S rRNA (guanosine2251-2'-O)-methyltransferase